MISESMKRFGPSWEDAQSVTVTAEFVVQRCITHVVSTWCEKEDFRWRLNVAVDDCMSFSSI